MFCNVLAYLCVVLFRELEVASEFVSFAEVFLCVELKEEMFLD